MSSTDLLYEIVLGAGTINSNPNGEAKESILPKKNKSWATSIIKPDLAFIITGYIPVF